MLELPEYWKAIAGAIDAEESKASLFIRHNHSRGVAREAILRDLLVKHTPEPYRVSTGFVYQFNTNWWHSRQCDVLVYDPTVSQPDYAIGGLVVLNRQTAKLAIEVKTTLDAATFAHVLDVHDSVHWLPIPMLGFAYDGWSFETFVGNMKESIKTSNAGVPDCIAVHRQNFLFIRSYYRLALPPGFTSRHRPAQFQFAVNLAAGKTNEGRAAATFLTFYLALLRGQFNEGTIERWLGTLELPKEAIVRFADNGDIEYGYISPRAGT